MFPPGHYNLNEMAKVLQRLFSNQEVKLQTEINSPLGGMVIYKNYNNDVKLDRALSELLGTWPELYNRTHAKRLASPSTYFIHYDLVDKEQNLFNGNPSSVLARFDIRENPFEKATYQAPPLNVLRDTSTGYHVSSLTISVRDGNSSLNLKLIKNNIYTPSYVFGQCSTECTAIR